MISYHPLHQGGFEKSKLCYQVCVFMPRAGSDMSLSLEMLNFLFSRWTKSDLSIRMGKFLACINQPNMRIESSHKIHWEGSKPYIFWMMNVHLPARLVFTRGQVWLLIPSQQIRQKFILTHTDSFDWLAVYRKTIRSRIILYKFI